MGILSLILIIANVIVSYRGFKDSIFYNKYKFNVDAVLLYKDYKRLVTSGFLHVNWMHLIFNMLALYFFSGSLELSLGPVRFLLIYFLSLIGGGLLSLFIHRHDGGYDSVGASAGVSGLIYAAIALFPGMKIGLLFIPIGIPGWLFGLVYVLYSIYGIRSRRNNIGHDAHLGGALIGLIVAIIMHPSVLVTNTWPIVIIMLPSVVFMYIIITRPHSLMIDNYFFNKHSNAVTIDHKYNIEKRSKEQEIDRILEKIHKKGMKSLTDKEKQMLQEYSR
ncbi:rhomboid family intramembrane serine protease [Parafilimonas terrae]|uniref:Membrane associated serine protease, rhomboid family n=1 Tax=Parafilimonas terrae TaxID=1465490 RepID=A0A1I5SP57_9BACT|nr:rhomboid family intramembrane serine protease [Parafilimonas terrae]SFP72533.1 Membrane associated serine protease, rhomboid family [Parafilimonas terrae]